MAEDRFSNLDPDPLSIILCDFDLPELVCLKLINRDINNHISSPNFAEVYRRRNSARFTWAISHLFTELDQVYGFLHFQRMIDDRVLTFQLEDFFQGLVGLHDELRLLSTSGSLSLFKIQNADGEARLYVLNVFTNGFETLPNIPDSLVFASMNYVKIIEDNLAYSIYCAQYVLGVVQYCQYHSEDGDWGQVVVGVRAGEADNLITDDPRNIIMITKFLTYLVSFPFVIAIPVFKMNEISSLLDYGLIMPFLREPPVVPLWHNTGREVNSIGDGYFAFVCVNDNHHHNPDLSVIRQVMLFQIKEDWSKFDLESICPVEYIPHQQLRLVPRNALEIIEGKVHLALSTFEEGIGFGYVLFLYDLHTKDWEDSRTPLAGQFSAVKPMFTPCLTLMPEFPRE